MLDLKLDFQSGQKMSESVSIIVSDLINKTNTDEITLIQELEDEVSRISFVCSTVIEKVETLIQAMISLKKAQIEECIGNSEELIKVLKRLEVSYICLKKIRN